MQSGFSILEIVIALALLSVVITGVLSAEYQSDYWVLTSQLSAEALNLAAANVGKIRYVTDGDFYVVSSTVPVQLADTSNPVLESCRAGGRCYWEQTKVTDISPCAKSIETAVMWQVGRRYATSSITQALPVFNSPEQINRGGDCLLSSLPREWEVLPPTRQVSTSTVPTFVTGVDVLGDRLYVVASSAPMVRIYKRPTSLDATLKLMSTSSVLGKRLNAIDVIRNVATGRLYAFVVQHTTTDQLMVLEVTSDEVTVVATRSLLGTDTLGSFPQGWRVMAYGDRLYVTTRETAGAELHIFSIADPTNPIEISSGVINLGRTVNDLTVRDQVVNGVVRRYLFLAASASLKELAIVEVTNDTPLERTAVDLLGTENALSLLVQGNTLFVGRQQSTFRPELYQFDIKALLAGSTTVLAQSEVGADVATIRGAGPLLLLGTTKSNAELQVWQSDRTVWSPLIVNAGRISASITTRLAPLGIDIDTDSAVAITQSLTQPESLIIWSN